MSSASKTKRRSRNPCPSYIEVDENENGDFDAVFIPQPDDSGDSDSESEDEELASVDGAIPKVSYSQVLDSYNEDQEKLEENHEYVWVPGEFSYEQSADDEILLPDRTKKMICQSTPVDFFELFFSKDMKTYIIENTCQNGCDLSPDDFDVFLGIIILSIFNQRKSERDFWSTNKLLACHPISSAMSRNKFSAIKSKLKLSKPEVADVNDKAWRVRHVLQLFRRNASQFGFFCTALSVDEMMVKFHGRTFLLQFMKNKPVRFGIKMWAIAGANGFLFD